jgi:hypothetical protein
MPILEPPYGIVSCGLDFHPRALSVAISGGVSRKRGARNHHGNELDSVVRRFTYGDLLICGCEMMLGRAMDGSKSKDFSSSAGVVHFKQNLRGFVSTKRAVVG